MSKRNTPSYVVLIAGLATDLAAKMVVDLATGSTAAAAIAVDMVAMSICHT